MAKKTFRIVTLGCKVNQYESAYLEEAFRDKGWSRAERRASADLVVINTCVVTSRASYQSRQAIRKAIRENPEARIVATGCYAQIDPEALAQIQGLSLIAGNTWKGRLPRVLFEDADAAWPCVLQEPFPSKPEFEVLPVRGHPGRTRAFLKIQDGCRSFCTYCIVPYARGGLRSLAPDGVLKALHGFCREGYQEVVLTGIHLGKYGVDLDPPTHLKALLRRIGREGLPLRVRISSLEPEEIDAELVDLVATEPWVCPHLHMPMQSGDNDILKRMNRKYTAEAFSEMVESLHQRLPEAGIGADVLVGFPGETEKAFENTRSRIEALPLSYLHVFRYSPRPGTPAAGFPDPVPSAVAKERAAVLRELGKSKRQAFYRVCLGKVYPVIAESWEGRASGWARGLADNYLPVGFSSGHDPGGKVLQVHAERLCRDGVAGRIVYPATEI